MYQILYFDHLRGKFMTCDKFAHWFLGRAMKHLYKCIETNRRRQCNYRIIYFETGEYHAGDYYVVNKKTGQIIDFDRFVPVTDIVINGPYAFENDQPLMNPKPLQPIRLPYDGP